MHEPKIWQTMRVDDGAHKTKRRQEAAEGNGRTSKRQRNERQMHDNKIMPEKKRSASTSGKGVI